MKLDMVVKYTNKKHAHRLQEAMGFWEKVAVAMVQIPPDRVS